MGGTFSFLFLGIFFQGNQTASSSKFSSKFNSKFSSQLKPKRLQLRVPLSLCAPVRPCVLCGSRSFPREAQTRTEIKDLINGGCRVQIDQLPVALDNSRANLPLRLALLMHGVSVIKLFETGAALRPVSARKAAV